VQDPNENQIGVKSANHFYMLDKTSGQLRSDIPLPAYGLGGAVLDDQLLYFGGSDFYFRCYDIRENKPVWEYPTGMENEATPLLDSSVVYWGSMDSVVYATHKITGETLWQFRTGCHIYGQPVIADSLLIIGSWDTYLYALNRKTGHLVWKFGAQAGIDQTPVIINRTIWLPDYDYRIYALDLQTGQLKYQFTAENAFEFGGAQWKNQFICTGIDRNFYFVDTDQYQVTVKGKTPVAVSCSPVVQENWLFTGQYDGSLYRWKLPDMEEELLYQFDDRVLAILSDGKYVWASSWDGALVCFPINKD
jgi:outer membrane protein assembly factor BamB